MNKSLLLGLCTFFILACIISTSQAIIDVTGENVTCTDDVLTITEPVNTLNGNLLLVNCTLPNESFVFTGNGKLIQYWHVLFNISNNYSYPLADIDVFINNSLGFDHNGTTNFSGKYNTNISQRYWNSTGIINLNLHNITYSQDNIFLGNQSVNVTTNMVVNVVLDWWNSNGGYALLMVGCLAAIIVGLISIMGITKSSFSQVFYLITTPFLIVLAVAVVSAFAVWFGATSFIIGDLDLIYKVGLIVGCTIIAFVLIYFIKEIFEVKHEKRYHYKG